MQLKGYLEDHKLLFLGQHIYLIFHQINRTKHNILYSSLNQTFILPFYFSLNYLMTPVIVLAQTEAMWSRHVRPITVFTIITESTVFHISPSTLHC